MLITLTDQNFEQEVMSSDLPVLIDFWSAYCQPCKVQMPIVEELSVIYNGKIKFAKMEAGDNPDTPAKYQVLSIPAIALFNNGKLLELKTGLQGKDALTGLIKHHLAI